MISFCIEKLSGAVYYALEFIDEKLDENYENDKIRIFYKILQLAYIFNVFIASIPLIILTFILKLFLMEKTNEKVS